MKPAVPPSFLAFPRLAGAPGSLWGSGSGVISARRPPPASQLRELSVGGWWRPTRLLRRRSESSLPGSALNQLEHKHHGEEDQDEGDIQASHRGNQPPHRPDHRLGDVESQSMNAVLRIGLDPAED